MFSFLIKYIRNKLHEIKSKIPAPPPKFYIFSFLMFFDVKCLLVTLLKVGRYENSIDMTARQYERARTHIQNAFQVCCCDLIFRSILICFFFFLIYLK